MRAPPEAGVGNSVLRLLVWISDDRTNTQRATPGPGPALVPRLDPGDVSRGRVYVEERRRLYVDETPR